MAVTNLISGHTYRLTVPSTGFSENWYIYPGELINPEVFTGTTAPSVPAGASTSIDRLYSNYTIASHYVFYLAAGKTSASDAVNCLDQSVDFIYKGNGYSSSAVFKYLTDITPKNIKLKDNSGKILYPKTSAALVSGLIEAVRSAFAPIKDVIILDWYYDDRYLWVDFKNNSGVDFNIWFSYQVVTSDGYVYQASDERILPPGGYDCPFELFTDYDIVQFLIEINYINTMTGKTYYEELSY